MLLTCCCSPSLRSRRVALIWWTAKGPRAGTQGPLFAIAAQNSLSVVIGLLFGSASSPRCSPKVAGDVDVGKEGPISVERAVFGSGKIAVHHRCFCSSGQLSVVDTV